MVDQQVVITTGMAARTAGELDLVAMVYLSVRGDADTPETDLRKW